MDIIDYKSVKVEMYFMESFLTRGFHLKAREIII